MDQAGFSSSLRSVLFNSKFAKSQSNPGNIESQQTHVDFMINAKEVKSRAELESVASTGKLSRFNSCTIINPLQKRREEAAKSAPIASVTNNWNSNAPQPSSIKNNSSVLAEGYGPYVADDNYAATNYGDNRSVSMYDPVDYGDSIMDYSYRCDGINNSRISNIGRSSSTNKMRLNSIVNKLAPTYENIYKNSVNKAKASLSSKALDRGDLDVYLDANKTYTFEEQYIHEDAQRQRFRSSSTSAEHQSSYSGFSNSLPTKRLSIVAGPIAESAMVTKYEADLEAVKKSFHEATATRFNDEKELNMKINSQFDELAADVSRTLADTEARLLSRIAKLHNRIEGAIDKAKESENEIKSTLKEISNSNADEIQQLRPELMQARATRIKENQKLLSNFIKETEQLQTDVSGVNANIKVELDVFKEHALILEEKLKADIDIRIQKINEDIKAVIDEIVREAETRECEHEKMVTAIEEVFAVAMQDILTLKEKKEREHLTYRGIL